MTRTPRARAPFAAAPPQGARSSRDRTLRRYLASFGIESPPKTEVDRREAEPRREETIKHTLTESHRQFGCYAMSQHLLN